MSEQQTVPTDDSSAGREPKIIKRYTNRKLYDTVESRYVTLEEIAEMERSASSTTAPRRTSPA
jgi:polyhydroxyalkanoate synthesis regulator protein